MFTKIFNNRITLFCSAALILTSTACNKKDDSKINFTTAIDNFYSAHAECLWQDPLKFPVQADTNDADKTRSYDALVDQGLLVRTTAEKTRFIVMSKQVNNYDISDKGRSTWTADPQQPGFGNFCYGHRKVSSIDAWAPTNNQPGATTTVQYHYTINDAADWAKNAETQTAFPNLRANLAAPQAASDNLTLTTTGWRVNTPAATSHTANPDSGIVQ
jgi:hypothetical protein